MRAPDNKDVEQSKPAQACRPSRVRFIKAGFAAHVQCSPVRNRLRQRQRQRTTATAQRTVGNGDGRVQRHGPPLASVRLVAFLAPVPPLGVRHVLEADPGLPVPFVRGFSPPEADRHDTGTARRLPLEGSERTASRMPAAVKRRLRPNKDVEQSKPAQPCRPSRVRFIKAGFAAHVQCWADPDECERYYS